MQRIFVTSSGTDVGKTHVVAMLARQARALGMGVFAGKPVASGIADGQWAGSDPARLAEAMGLGIEAVPRISPWRFGAALSPHMAAEREGRVLTLEALVAQCRSWEQEGHDLLLVEGVGGVMVPLNREHLVLDWMVALGWPVLLVVGSYLGALSHGLTALATLREAGVDVIQMVVSESPESAGGFVEMVESFRLFAGVEVVGVPRGQDVPELLMGVMEAER